MKERIMNNLQKFSKAMFIPVLILPIAGLLIAIGNILTNQTLIERFPLLGNPVTTNFGSILSASLLPILTNLGLIFCVGVALGLANTKKAEAAFTSVLVYFIFVYAMNKFMQISGILVEPENLRGSGQTLVMGIQVLDMGVFLGIILGLLVAYFHNKYINTTFNNAFQIYGGARFVFIVLIPTTIILAIIFTLIWPFIQLGIDSLGGVIQRTGNFGIFLYGMLERLLIPTGLHHLVYTPFLYSSLGGSVEIGGQLYEGARNIYFAEISDPAVKVLSKSVVWDARGIPKMFGLIGACLAMYQTALPQNKEKVKAILIPAAFTSFIAGVTEPIEFSFMFVSPLLFVIHSILGGLSMVALNVFGSRAIGPNGFIDFLLYNLPAGIEKTRWPIYIAVGIAFFFIYYFIFKILIVKLNLKTIGRESNAETVKLYSKKEYNQKQKDAVKETEKGNQDLSAVIVEAIGGVSNIISINNCYTRLRLELKDSSLVNEALLKEETGAHGVVIKGQNVQIIYGLQVEGIKSNLVNYVNNEEGIDIK